MPRPSLHHHTPRQIMDFYAEALRRLFKGKHIVILDAAAAHLARAGGAAAIAQGLGNLDTADVLLAPINDAPLDGAAPPPGAAAAGSHWSLVAFDRRAWAWTHYDSSPDSANEGEARELADQLRPHMGRSPGGPGGGTPPGPAFCEGAAPKQANGSDCGLHALLSARAVAGALLSGSDARAAVSDASTPAAAAAARGALRACIEAAVAAGEVANDGAWVPPPPGLPGGPDPRGYN